MPKPNFVIFRNFLTFFFFFFCLGHLGLCFLSLIVCLILCLLVSICPLCFLCHFCLLCLLSFCPCFVFDLVKKYTPVILTTFDIICTTIYSRLVTQECSMYN